MTITIHRQVQIKPMLYPEYLVAGFRRSFLRGQGTH